MTRKTRWHVDELPSDAQYTPRHLTKQEFGRRLYQEMLARGWNQSELARQSGLPRDSISTYIRGRAFPTPKSLQKLAECLNVLPAEVLPNSVESAVDEDLPAFEMRVSTAAPSMAWVRVNQLVSLSTATRIADLLEGDKRERAAVAD